MDTDSAQFPTDQDRLARRRRHGEGSTAAPTTASLPAQPRTQTKEMPLTDQSGVVEKAKRPMPAVSIERKQSFLESGGRPSVSVTLQAPDQQPVQTLGDLIAIVEQAKKLADASGITQSAPEVTTNWFGKRIKSITLTW